MLALWLPVKPKFRLLVCMSLHYSLITSSHTIFSHSTMVSISVEAELVLGMSQDYEVKYAVACWILSSFIEEVGQHTVKEGPTGT